MPKLFTARGTTVTRQGKETLRREVEVRKPIYFVFIVDTSGSMSEKICVVCVKGGAEEHVSKIEQLNEGLAKAIESLRSFEKSNSQFKVYFQIIELNSYGHAMFPEGFIPLSDREVVVDLNAGGATCLENSLNTLTKYLTPDYMPNCRRAVNVILMSDGEPTDVNGYALLPDRYGAIIKTFKDYLVEKQMRSNVDLYAIGVDGACKDMLTLFADEGKYYDVGSTESLANWIDRVTRVSFRISSEPRRIFHSGASVPPPPAAPTPAPAPVSPSAPAPAQSGSGVKKTVDISRCAKGDCLACMDACPKAAICYESGLVAINESLCDGCDACLGACPHGAITDAVGFPFGD